MPMQFHKQKLKSSLEKIEMFKYFDSKHTLPRRGGSNKYPQCMFLIKNKKNRFLIKNKQNGYPSFAIKVGCKGIYISRTCFPDEVYFTRLGFFPGNFFLIAPFLIIASLYLFTIS